MGVKPRAPTNRLPPIFLWPSRHTSACYEMAILADNGLSIYIANVENISPFRLLKPPCNPTA